VNVDSKNRTSEGQAKVPTGINIANASISAVLFVASENVRFL